MSYLKLATEELAFLRMRALKIIFPITKAVKTRLGMTINMSKWGLKSFLWKEFFIAWEAIKNPSGTFCKISDT